MSNATPPPPAGWYPDPSGEPGTRWWNGLAWTSTRQSAAGQTPAAPRYPDPPSPGAYGSPGYPVAPAPGAAAVPYGVGHGYGAAPAAPPYTGVQPYAPAPWRAPRPVVRGMGDAIRVVMNKYGTFEGLAGRPEFWYWYLFNVLISFGALLLLLVPYVGIAVYLLFLGWALAIIVPTLAVSVRRLRDAGLHWGFLFLQLVPFGSIVLLIMFCQPSKTP